VEDFVVSHGRNPVPDEVPQARDIWMVPKKQKGAKVPQNAVPKPSQPEIKEA
jgi:hypothetical protein